MGHEIEIPALTREQMTDGLRLMTVAASVWVGSRFLPRISDHRENRAIFGCVGGVAGLLYGLLLAHSPVAAISIAGVVGTVVYNAHDAYVTGVEPRANK